MSVLNMKKCFKSYCEGVTLYEITVLPVSFIQLKQRNKMNQTDLEKAKIRSEKVIKDFNKLIVDTFGEKEFERSKKLSSVLSEEQLMDYTDRSMKLNNGFKNAIEKKMAHDSDEVTSLLKEHLELLSYFNEMDKEKYLEAMSHLKDSSNFHKVYNAIHVELPEFLYSAMAVFANNCDFDKK